MYPFQFDLLWTIKQYGPMTAGELAARRGMRVQQTATQVAGSLRPLTQRGLVMPAKQIGKPNIYGLTAKGRRIVDA